jgi:hypothetical protein
MCRYLIVRCCGVRDPLPALEIPCHYQIVFPLLECICTIPLETNEKNQYMFMIDDAIALRTNSMGMVRSVYEDQVDERNYIISAHTIRASANIFSHLTRPRTGKMVGQSRGIVDKEHSFQVPPN